jgi:UDP-N-acetylmuramate dehydrogenase
MPSDAAQRGPQIRSDVSLRALNTFGIEARARHFATVTSTTDLQALQAESLYRQLPRFVLGGGSNVLFTRDVDRLVIHNAVAGIEVVRQDSMHAWVRVGAGEIWHDFVCWSVDRGWGGIENLALIPGRVGAAPMQNIGAYGVEMESSCESVEAVDLESGASRTFTHRDCEFGYRDSVFKHAARDCFCIVAVTFRLQKKPQLVTHYGDVRATLEAAGVQTPTVRDVAAAVERIRRAKLPDPERIGNAGSFFKNPVVTASELQALLAIHPDMPHWPQPGGGTKVPAAWLIERCGWKGRRSGHAGVHDRQALVLVNHGGAQGHEILALSVAIQASVRARFGIDLVREVNVL